MNPAFFDERDPADVTTMFETWTVKHPKYGDLVKGMKASLFPQLLDPYDDSVSKEWVASWADPTMRTKAAACIAEFCAAIKRLDDFEPLP